MKFAFFMMPLHTPNENPSLAFERDIDMINYAEKLGFDEYFIGEHHSAAWETMPMPEMVLAKASATATRITLGTGVWCHCRSITRSTSRNASRFSTT